MNGKKAKLFRALAGVNKQNAGSRSYHGVEHTVCKHEVHHPTLLTEDGKKMVIGHYTTATYALNQCARLLNKMLKGKYKTAKRSGTSQFA